MGIETQQLSPDAVKSISEGLAASPDLRLPGQMTKAGAEPPSFEKRKKYLEALLLRDPGVFLERHGELLSPEERAAFEPLRGDYEVDFYIKVLEDKQDSHKQDTAAKNRRLAYMNRLLREGVYFSDEQMKDRQPWLHHQYVGQYTPPGEAAGTSAPPPAGPAAEAAAQQGSGGGGGVQQGVPLSQSLLRHQEELEAMLAQRAEQEQYDRMEEDSESESEEGEVAAGGWSAGAAAGGTGGRGRGREGGGEGREEEEEGQGYVIVSGEERQENAEAFLDLMKEKFLRGEDRDVDYKAIDADASLDDDWIDQAGRDAEEKYFDEE